MPLGLPTGVIGVWSIYLPTHLGTKGINYPLLPAVLMQAYQRRSWARMQRDSLAICPLQLQSEVGQGDVMWAPGAIAHVTALSFLPHFFLHVVLFILLFYRSVSYKQKLSKARVKLGIFWEKDVWLLLFPYACKDVLTPFVFKRWVHQTFIEPQILRKVLIKQLKFSKFCRIKYCDNMEEFYMQYGFGSVVKAINSFRVVREEAEGKRKIFINVLMLNLGFDTSRWKGTCSRLNYTGSKGCRHENKTWLGNWKSFSMTGERV